MNFLYETTDGNVYNLDAIIALRQVKAKNSDTHYHWMETMRDESILLTPNDFQEVKAALFDEKLRTEHYRRTRKMNDAIFAPDPPAETSH